MTTNPSPFSKFTTRWSNPNASTFPELPICITWLRLFLGLVCGLTLGLRDINGGFGLLTSLTILTFLPMVYVEIYLGANTYSYSNLTFAGVPNAMALVLLIWIGFYTEGHGEEERSLAAIVLEAAKVFAEEEVNGAVGEDVGIADIVDSDPQQIMESEF
mmetsp:Transcript_22446/g.27686  ORF Transcript_22446/g.27686 Transcript_22446/m.27686 type:complete len:159 (-) Transcript_22446:42-518(-)|eukprot:CAMPEP_0172501540 /NCGR_PEP_ID=MMETSP1066-20121228/150743_1 /TAXON_ID=671091 /ORGANISM="Coscinodiscus wailesii, Strain CCMP2513" /LENGTH=158 /DNA_ID=CAMNT_0013276361 /DNA_START=164 /DNA_END=640 /DNA_ORIENTATION=+